MLIHDAQYTNTECQGRKGWGHSSIDQAVAFATLCGAGLLVPFHHDPGHDDIQLDGMITAATGVASLTIEPGREGLELVV